MSTEHRSVLVTGGAGYVGSHACKALKQAGYNPITVDNLCHGHREAVRWGAFEEVDILDGPKLLSIFHKYQPWAVLHFAAFAYVEESVRDPAKYYRNNVQGSLSLLNAMVEADCKRIVFSSSCATYGVPSSVPITEKEATQPINPYGKTKKMVEEMLADCDQSYGLRSVSLRYFNAAGADPEGEIGESHEPETHVIPLCLAAARDSTKKFTLYGTDYPTVDGTCVRDFIHVTDLAEAHVAALGFLEKNQRTGIFNLGTGRGVSVQELVAAVEKITNRKISLFKTGRRAGDPPQLIADSSRANQELGWVPHLSDIEVIIEHAWKWHNRK